MPEDPDVLIVGAGVAGSFVARALTAAGRRCLLLEAGFRFEPGRYPRKEIDANSQLYWSGGLELNTAADIAFLRPKCVGGGSVVNQALVDRFDDDALDSWRKVSGVPFFTRSAMDPFYDRAEAEVEIRTIPAERRNRNALIFQEGFEKNGFRCAPLRRAQGDCRWEDGNDCIECLAGCPIQSKQSTPWTALAKAEATGLLSLVPEVEVQRVWEDADGVGAEGIRRGGARVGFRARKLVLCSGAIGNSKLLLQSGFGSRLPALGHGFYTHPQYMSLAFYDEPVLAHKGPFQALKSDDPGFRKEGFKLENVFAPPVGLAMLLGGLGRSHQERMRRLGHMACIEVAVRDTEPGVVRAGAKGQSVISKTLNDEDRRRRDRGLDAVDRIFRTTGAREVERGQLAIGLHLMGGCAVGTDPGRSVVSPEFRLHGFRSVYAADSSIFPNAPGINPSLTIMALALRAAEEVKA